MTLVPQIADGTAVGANCYDTLAAFKTYHDLRGNDYSGFADPLIEQAIVRATDYHDVRFLFKGVRLLGTQSTAWPRKQSQCGTWNIRDLDGNEVIGIPDAVHRACFEFSFRALSIPLFQDNPAPEGGRLIDEHTVKVDVIEEAIKYAPSQAGGFAIGVYPQAEMWLSRAGLIEPGRVLYR